MIWQVRCKQWSSSHNIPKLANKAYIVPHKYWYNSVNKAYIVPTKKPDITVLQYEMEMPSF